MAAKLRKNSDSITTPSPNILASTDPVALGEGFPLAKHIAILLLLGFVAYGLSIYCYTYAQRTIGAALQRHTFPLSKKHLSILRGIAAT